ncbi:MAG: BolA family transcriptional regulator [Alphaproteobacteria bacterium]|nr:BolA family transcriptional regulator [Alphaproteobacteria bacterium]OJV47076.1 MAG: hypothetical protein BGO28_01345 [Alphaproteobacteria bacterium 43-37]
MTRRDQISQSLTHAFSPFVLEVIDESHKHAGHSGVPEGSSETHFKVKIGAEKLSTLSRVQAHRLINDVLKSFFEEGLHALSIEIMVS